jgi:hypothetical protein
MNTNEYGIRYKKRKIEKDQEKKCRRDIVPIK